MIVAAFVTVVVDGVRIDGSSQASLQDDLVVAPIAPYARAIAERIVNDAGGERFVFQRGSRTFTIRIGSRVARNGGVTESLRIAPYLRAGEAIIPLASVARGLGASVAYDGPSHTLTIALGAEPLATITPSAAIEPAGPFPTFTPTATQPPRPTVSGIPKPRRTPILVEPSPLETLSRTAAG